VTSKRLSHAIWLVGFLALGGLAAAKAMPAPVAADRAAFTLEDASQHRASQDRASEDRIQLAQAQAQQTPAPDAAAQTDQQGAPEEPIGNVATLTGVATVTRNNTDTPLQLKDDIYLNDVVKTQATSSLSITFNDATTFRLSANAEITIDNYVYEEGGAGNAGTFDIARGTVAFVAAQVAKTGKMEISTPTATLGIRGTTGVVDVPEGVTATSANNVNIKLYPDADGRVGQIEINDRQGARLGALTQGASGFAIRAGAGGARFAAVPIVMSAGRSSPNNAPSAAPIRAGSTPTPRGGKAANSSPARIVRANRAKTAGVSSSNCHRAHPTTGKKTGRKIVKKTAKASSSSRDGRGSCRARARPRSRPIPHSRAQRLARAGTRSL
jgi:hypothetical protein